MYEFAENDAPAIVDAFGLFGDGTVGHPDEVWLGHSDFDNSFGIFNFTAEDHSFWRNPLTPWGIHYHFQSLNESIVQIRDAIRSCNLADYNSAMHRMQDYYSHYSNGYRGDATTYLLDLTLSPIDIPFSFIFGTQIGGWGHIDSFLPEHVNPDHDYNAWLKAQKATIFFNKQWYSKCGCKQAVVFTRSQVAISLSTPSSFNNSVNTPVLYMHVQH